MQEIGERIRLVREALNLSRADFSKLIGISHTTLYNYESGERMPTADVVAKIGEVTNTVGSWLLTGNGLQCYEDLELLLVPIIEDLLTVCGMTVANGLTEDERILLTHKFRTVLGARILELFNDHYTAKRDTGNKQVKDNSENVNSNITGNNGIISNGNNTVNINGNDNYNFSGKVEGGVNITTKTKKVTAKIQPAQGTIGANPLLDERITGLFNELGLRRKERYGKTGFSVMQHNFKNDFSIPKTQKYTAYKLWPESRAQEIIDYLEEKISNTIQGKKEKASAKKGHNVPYLLSETTRLHKILGWSESDYRGRLHYLFGVTSRVDLNQSQLKNYVEFLRQEIEKM